eukprot:GHVR01055488.1.p1 GENE.GHVR01055488.1~~GHVR01055488.1.p1  ORF type:complete len:515 (-),score=130.90 GHVR01055488.1:146-1690(-)
MAKYPGLRGEVSFSVPIIVESDISPFAMPEEILTYEVKQSSVLRRFKNGEVLRQIFMNQILNEEEKNILKEFNEVCKEENIKIPNGINHLTLRVLLFNHRKFKAQYISKSLEMMEDMIKWRKSYFPIEENEVIQYLTHGVIYFTGRDTEMRPTLILRMSRMPSAWTPQIFSRIVIFTLEYMLRYAAFPGKVETMVVLVDLKGVSLLNVPMKAMKEMSSLLTRQYPFRLHSMYVVNAPTLISMVWGAVKVTLSEVQQSKINFVSSKDKVFKENWAPHQLEENYGGTLKETKTFYPFPFQPGPFEHPPTITTTDAPVPHVWKVFDGEGHKGTLWITEAQEGHPLQFSPEAAAIYRQCGIPFAGQTEMESTGAQGVKRAGSMRSNRSSIDGIQSVILKPEKFPRIEKKETQTGPRTPPEKRGGAHTPEKKEELKPEEFPAEISSDEFYEAQHMSDPVAAAMEAAVDKDVTTPVFVPPQLDDTQADTHTKLPTHTEGHAGEEITRVEAKSKCCNCTIM